MLFVVASDVVPIVPMLNVVMDIEHVCGESVVQVEGSEINNLDPLSKTENKRQTVSLPTHQHINIQTSTQQQEVKGKLMCTHYLYNSLPQTKM